MCVCSVCVVCVSSLQHPLYYTMFYYTLQHGDQNSLTAAGLGNGDMLRVTEIPESERTSEYVIYVYIYISCNIYTI